MTKKEILEQLEMPTSPYKYEKAIEALIKILKKEVNETKDEIKEHILSEFEYSAEPIVIERAMNTMIEILKKEVENE